MIQRLHSPLPVLDHLGLEDRVHSAERAPQDHLRGVEGLEPPVDVLQSVGPREGPGVGESEEARGVHAELVGHVAPEVLVGDVSPCRLQ